MRSSRDYAATFLLLALLAVNFFALARKADDPLRIRGESWEDPKTLMAGEAFARDGFLAHRLTPYVQTTPLAETPEAFRFHYGRSQSLGYLVNGLLRLAGVETIRGFRLVAALVYTMGLAALFWFFRQASSPRTALLATALAASFPPMYILGDSPSMHSYLPLLFFGPLALWLHADRRPESRKWAWPLLWVLLLLQFLFTFHGYAMLFHFFVWGRMALAERRVRWKEAALWLSASACAAALVLARNAWLMGGDAALVDIGSKLIWRMYGADVTGALPDAGWSVAEGAADMAMRLASNFGPAALALLLLAFLGRRTLAEEKPALQTAGLLIAAALAHAAIFFQAASIHYFTMRDFAPASALLLAAAAGAVWRAGRSERAWWKLAACIALVAGVAGLSVNRCRNLESSDEGRLVSGELRALEASLPQDAALVFAEFSPYPLYYLRRPTLSESSFPSASGAERFLRESPWPGRRAFWVTPRETGTLPPDEAAARSRFALWAETGRFAVYTAQQTPAENGEGAP